MRKAGVLMIVLKEKIRRMRSTNSVIEGTSGSQRKS
jgi:hypothetical protein